MLLGTPWQIKKLYPNAVVGAIADSHRRPVGSAPTWRKRWNSGRGGYQATSFPSWTHPAGLYSYILYRMTGWSPKQVQNSAPHNESHQGLTVHRDSRRTIPLQLPRIWRLGASTTDPRRGPVFRPQIDDWQQRASLLSGPTGPTRNGTATAAFMFPRSRNRSKSAT